MILLSRKLPALHQPLTSFLPIVMAAAQTTGFIRSRMSPSCSVETPSTSLARKMHSSHSHGRTILTTRSSSSPFYATNSSSTLSYFLPSSISLINLSGSSPYSSLYLSLEADWLARMPMTKASIKAMDASQAFWETMRGNLPPIEQYDRTRPTRTFTPNFYPYFLLFLSHYSRSYPHIYSLF